MFRGLEILLFGFHVLNFPKELFLAVNTNNQIKECILIYLELSSLNASRLGAYVKACPRPDNSCILLKTSAL
jgi:hypothetical protein